MASNGITVVGRSSETRFVAYGDDCQFDDLCGYALLVVKRIRIPWMVREINKIKDEYRIPHSTALHCRVLFSFHQRQKAGLEHLSDADARSIVLKCLLLVNNLGAHVRFVSGSLKHFSDSMGSSLTMRNQAGEQSVELPVHANAKALIGLLAQIALITPGTDRKFGHPSEWEQVISQDATKVKSIGDGRRQVHNLMSGGFSDIGLPPGEFHQFMPHISTEAEHPLLQLADVVVYSLTHALDTGEKASFWRNEVPSMRWVHHIPFAAVQQGV
ncbi:hypothetical protein M1D55_14930 [Cupriavidus sp. JZ107]